MAACTGILALRKKSLSKWRSGRVAEGAPLLREYTVYPVSRVRIPPSPPFIRYFLKSLYSIELWRDENPTRGFEPKRSVDNDVIPPSLDTIYIKAIRHCQKINQHYLLEYQSRLMHNLVRLVHLVIVYREISYHLLNEIFLPGHR